MSAWSTSRVGSAGKAFVLVLAAYLANYFITPVVVGEKLEIYFRPHGSAAFDSGAWKQADPRTRQAGGTVPYGRRYEMVDSLLDSKMLLGANEQRVRDLLGTPESTSEKDGRKGLYYFLGDQRQYPSRSIWFPCLFTNQDRWMLEVVLRDAKVIIARVYYT